MLDQKYKISVSFTGSYAITEIASALRYAVKDSGNVLVKDNADLNIMIRGVDGTPPPKPNVLILTDEPYEVDHTETFSHKYDLVTTNDKSTLHRHKNCIYMPMGFDIRILREVSEPCESSFLASHVGGCYPGRKNWINPILNHYKKGFCLVGHGWPQRKIYKRRVSIKEALNIYSNSVIVVNPHRNNIYSARGKLNKKGLPATHLAPRVFDCAAVGALQIVDSNRSSEDMPSLLSASSPERMLSMVRYYSDKRNFLESHQIRLKQAEEGRAHTWTNRLIFILGAAIQNGLL